MELTDALKTVCIDTAESLTGSARRLFMARVVEQLGRAASAVPNGSWAGAG